MSSATSPGPFDAEALIASLGRFPAALSSLVESLDEDILRWRSPQGHWSIHEIVCHLLDEERADFRARLERTLRDPMEAWDGIDPEGWVDAHDYASWDFGTTFSALRRERADSLGWLHGLAAPDWTSTHAHPRLGSMSAGDLLLSWAQHDLLHLRQIVKRLHERSAHDGLPHRGVYAGSW